MLVKLAREQFIKVPALNSLTFGKLIVERFVQLANAYDSTVVQFIQLIVDKDVQYANAVPPIVCTAEVLILLIFVLANADELIIEQEVKLMEDKFKH